MVLFEVLGWEKIRLQRKIVRFRNNLELPSSNQIVRISRNVRMEVIKYSNK